MGQTCTEGVRTPQHSPTLSSCSRSLFYGDDVDPPDPTAKDDHRSNSSTLNPHAPYLDVRGETTQLLGGGMNCPVPLSYSVVAQRGQTICSTEGPRSKLATI